MSKYIPPNMRNKKVVPEPTVVEKTEENFPTFITTTKATVFDKKNGKTFANLASEWASKHEEDKSAEDLKNKEKEHIETLRKQYRLAPLPQIKNVRHFVEPEDDEEVTEQSNKVSQPEEEAWTEVSYKKYRRPKTFEERMNRPPTPEEKPDGTVWEANDDEESDWKNH
jgi:hypothetical protein